MRGEKNFKPRPGKFEKVNGKFVEPENDAYITLITKFYTPDGTVESSSWFFNHKDLVGWSMVDNFFVLVKKSVNGRGQTSYYPTSEIIRIDFNDASPAYYAAYEGWCQQEFSISYEEWSEINNGSKKEEESFKARKGLATSLGIPVDNVIDLGNGHLGVKISERLDGEDGEF